MAVSWQAVRSRPTASPEAGLASDPDNPGDPDNTGDPDGPEPDSEDTEILPALPRQFADGDARRAALRELALRALI